MSSRLHVTSVFFIIFAGSALAACDGPGGGGGGGVPLANPADADASNDSQQPTLLRADVTVDAMPGPVEPDTDAGVDVAGPDVPGVDIPELDVEPDCALNACGFCGALPAEVCDGVDNDCDGAVDEGLLNACGECGTVPEEVCDEVDNDCDGAVDEGLNCVVACTTELFFSEYYEDEGNLKALEITNLTGADVDLEDYAIYSWANVEAGETWDDSVTSLLTGTLAHGESFVICNNAMVELLGTICDYSNGTVASFNGNDARALVYLDMDVEIIVDVIGGPGDSPGDGWTVANVPAISGRVLQRPTDYFQVGLAAQEPLDFVGRAFGRNHDAAGPIPA